MLYILFILLSISILSFVKTNSTPQREAQRRSCLKGLQRLKATRIHADETAWSSAYRKIDAGLGGTTWITQSCIKFLCLLYSKNQELCYKYWLTKDFEKQYFSDLIIKINIFRVSVWYICIEHYGTHRECLPLWVFYIDNEEHAFGKNNFWERLWSSCGKDFVSKSKKTERSLSCWDGINHSPG